MSKDHPPSAEPHIPFLLTCPGCKVAATYYYPTDEIVKPLPRKIWIQRVTCIHCRAIFLARFRLFAEPYYKKER